MHSTEQTTDQKWYADKASYYAELKGVEDEIKLAQEQIDETINRGVCGEAENREQRGDTSGNESEVHKDTKYDRAKRKSEGAGDESEIWRVR